MSLESSVLFMPLVGMTWCLSGFSVLQRYYVMFV